jgi:hypothetical protein
MAVRTVQEKRIPCGFFMFGRKNHAGKPLLVQVPKFEGDVAELNRTVSAYPKQMVSVAWHPHIRFFQ